jgi:hypothetical protein
MPKDIRGSLNSMEALFSSIGILIFSKLTGFLFDTYGLLVPFLFIAACDFLFGAFVLILKKCGKLEEPVK